MGDHCPGEADGVPDVEFEGRREIIRRGIQQVAADGAAHIRHCTVEAAQRFGRLVDSAPHCPPVSDVYGDVENPRLAPLQVGARPTELIASAREDRDVGTFGGQRVRDGPADTTARPGDHEAPAL
jgi:hypothetical protein